MHCVVAHQLEQLNRSAALVLHDVVEARVGPSLKGKDLLLRVKQLNLTPVCQPRTHVFCKGLAPQAVYAVRRDEAE